MQKSNQKPGMENILFQVPEASGERLKLPPFAKRSPQWHWPRIFRIHPFTLLIIVLIGLWTIESIVWLMMNVYKLM